MDNEEVIEIEDLNLEPETRMEQILNGETLEPEDRTEYFVQKALGRFGPTPPTPPAPSSDDFFVVFPDIYFIGDSEITTTTPPADIVAAYNAGKNVYATDEDHVMRLPCVYCQDGWICFSGIFFHEICQIEGLYSGDGADPESATWVEYVKDVYDPEIDKIHGEITKTQGTDTYGFSYYDSTSTVRNALLSSKQLFLEADFDGNRFIAPMVKVEENPAKSRAIIDLGDNRSFAITIRADVANTGLTTWTKLTERFTLPEYSAADAGKLLGIDENGNLAWVER